MMNLKIRGSHAKVFEACKRKYDLMVNQKIVAKGRKPALSIGSACHAGRAGWLKTWDSGVALTAVHEYLAKEVEMFPDFLKVPHDGKAYCKCFACCNRIALETIGDYTLNFEKRFPKGSLKILAIELPFELKIAEWEGLELWVVGTADADAIYANKYRVNYEYKTTGKQLPYFFDQECMSRQHTTYPFALTRIRGEEFHGTILEASRKPGKTYAPEHDHMVLTKNEDDYSETLVYYTELLKSISRHIDENYWPHNPNSCFGIYGRCEYFNLCKYNMDPRILRNDYVVIDDNAQIVAEIEDEDV